MDVSFIIVNYNTADFVRICIESIREFTKSVRYEILLVDNASPNRDIEKIVSIIAADDLVFLQATTNKGFGAGNNLALSRSRGKYLFLLNPDTRLSSDAAGYFFSYMEKKDANTIAGCGAALVNGNGTPVQSYGNFPTIFGAISALGLKIFYPNYYRKKLSLGVANIDLQEKKVDYISGAAMFVRKKIVDQIGFFDEDFFLFFEETEWAYRLKKNALELVVLPEVRIIHDEGGSDEAVLKNSFSMRRFTDYEKSKQLFYRKTSGAYFAWLMKPLDLLYVIIKTWAGKEGGNWVQKAKIIWEA
jgi:GT2 family glycosyltransferase